MNRLNQVIQILLIVISIVGLLAHSSYRVLIGKEDENSLLLFLLFIVPLLPLFYTFLEGKIKETILFKSKPQKRLFYTLTLLTFVAIVYFVFFSLIPYRYGFAVILLILLMLYLMLFNRL